MRDLFSVNWEVNKDFYTQYSSEILSKIPEPDEGILIKYAAHDRKILSEILISGLNIVFYESDTGIRLSISYGKVLLTYNSDVVMSFDVFVSGHGAICRTSVTINQDYFDANRERYVLCPEEIRDACQIINYLGLAVLRGDYILIYEKSSKSNAILKLPIVDRGKLRDTIFKYAGNSKALRDLGSAGIAEYSNKNIGIMLTYRSDKPEKFTEEFSRRIYCETIISESGDIDIQIHMDDIVRKEPYSIQYLNVRDEPKLNITGLLKLDGVIAALESTDAISDYAQCYMYVCDYLQYLGILESHGDGVKARTYIKTFTS